jgi:hypothetical protein
MPFRIFPAVATVFLLCSSGAYSAEKDHLQRGEREPTEKWEAPYIQAVHSVLSRAWRKDVVVRMLDLPPFQPEWASGISRNARGYRAFSVAASKQIWSVMTGDAKGIKKGNYHAIPPISHEKELPEAIGTRVATLWRRFLTDPQNYGKDRGLYLDTDQFSFYLAFLPREKLSANMTGWGTKGERMIDVAAAIDAYAAGKVTERELLGVIEKAERKLGTR